MRAHVPQLRPALAALAPPHNHLPPRTAYEWRARYTPTLGPREGHWARGESCGACGGLWPCSPRRGVA